MSIQEDLDLEVALLWYRSNPKVLAEYCGEWVAIGPEGVLAHGDDLKKVMVQSKRKGLPRPLLCKVPPKGMMAVQWG